MMDHTFRKIYEIRLFRNLFIGEIFEATQSDHVHANDTGGKEVRAWDPGCHPGEREVPF